MNGHMDGCCGGGKVGGSKMGDGWVDVKEVERWIGVGDMDGC